MILPVHFPWLGFLAVLFDTFEQSTSKFLDRPLLSFDSSGPSTLAHKTVQFGLRPFTFGWTVHFDSLGSDSLNRGVDMDTELFENRGMGMDVDTEIFEERGVDMDVVT